MSARAISAFRQKEFFGQVGRVLRSGPCARLTSADVNANTLPNPFVPHRNPVSQKWSPPKYSLRQQAELIKHARAVDMLPLLPPGPKLLTPGNSALTKKSDRGRRRVSTGDAQSMSSERGQEELVMKKGGNIPGLMGPVVWEGKVKTRVIAGADVGTRLYAAKKRMFKGHKWERAKEGRDRKKQILLRDMARRVKNYKAYYQKRRPNPLKPSRSSKAPKLPF